MTVSHWGPHFPDAAQANVKHWSVHFPDGGQDPNFFPPYGPPGVATLIPKLESGFKVTYSWNTDIHKFRSGKERRASRNDAPKQRYSGTALLLGTTARQMRAKLAKFAAIGSQFLLGLPHEELSLRADSSGASVFVSSTAQGLTDWCKIGQRVVVVAPDDSSSIDATIQDPSAPGTLVLDVSPGVIGKQGGRIMPAFPIFLDPEQAFDRYPVNAEAWTLSAIASIFDFALTHASLALSTVTTSGGLNGIVLYARAAGLTNIQVEFSSSAGNPAAGSIVEVGPITTINYKPGVTTLTNLAALFLISTNLKMTGTFVGANTISALDAFISPVLGGSASGDVGTGAALTTYLSSPVWDRGLEAAGGVVDSIHAMTEIIDFGGIPYSIGLADEPDWGRAVRFESDRQSEWQWWKLFLSTVKGCQKSWWLSTWRNDLTFVSKAAGTITINGPNDTADFNAWYPAQRQHVQIVQTDGTITRAQITSAVDNGNGTITLTIGTTISGVAVSMISWLELCRFESDDFEVTWSDGYNFAIETTARVVQQ
jgi:hypothetical protein